MRIGYAVTASETANVFQMRTPPYIVSTLAQLAGIAAFEAEDYYLERVQH
jgi:histidinol-phosphate/aromatic aminotransferase/cobyric acid decarboxylase-like protein